VEKRASGRPPSGPSGLSHAWPLKPQKSQQLPPSFVSLRQLRKFPDCRDSVQTMLAHLEKSSEDEPRRLDTIPSEPASPSTPLSRMSWKAPEKSKWPGLRVLNKPSMSRSYSQTSQAAFAEPTQTAFIFDWDDTLFPTSFLLHQCKLSGLMPLKEQSIEDDLKMALEQSLGDLASEVIDVLRLASSRGRVVLVTLAKTHWVKVSCGSFMPRVWEVIRELNVKVVYAQEGFHPRETGSMEAFRYARMKARAITRELEDFYSQYEGQSWKNVISIGDSQNERLGTMEATEVYMQRRRTESSPTSNSNSSPRGVMSALAQVSGRALAEAAAVLHIQKVYRGHAARQRSKESSGLLPHLKRAKESLSAAINRSFDEDTIGELDREEAVKKELERDRRPLHVDSWGQSKQSSQKDLSVSLPKCYANHAALPSFHLPPADSEALSAKSSPILRAVDGHVLKVRTKTLKMVDGPSIMELWVQLRLVKSWLQGLVKLDKNFDADLNSVYDLAVLHRMEETLGPISHEP